MFKKHSNTFECFNMNSGNKKPETKDLLSQYVSYSQSVVEIFG